MEAKRKMGPKEKKMKSLIKNPHVAAAKRILIGFPRDDEMELWYDYAVHVIAGALQIGRIAEVKRKA